MPASTTQVPQAYSVNTDSPSNSKVQSVSGARINVNGVNLPASQAVSLTSNMKHELLTVGSATVPVFGGVFNIDIKEKNILLHNMGLQFVTGPVVGTSLVGQFNPSWFFVTRIEFVQSGNVVATAIGNEQFIINQWLDWDEDRLAINNSAGNYASATQRLTLSSQSTTNTFYINLKSYFDQTKLALLTDNHNIQIRVTMDTLKNAFGVTSGTLISCPILSCSAICKITRMDQATVQQRSEDMRVYGNHSIFHDLKAGSYTVQSGLASTSIILNNVVGNIACLLFTVRSTTAGSLPWNYLPIASFALADSGGTNIVGGQAIPAAYAVNLLNKDFCKSSYNTETSYGSNNQSANVFCWSFSADMISALTHGQALSSRRMTGQEQLILTFPSTLTSPVQVDVYAYAESIVDMTLTSVRKINI